MSETERPCWANTDRFKSPKKKRKTIDNTGNNFFIIISLAAILFMFWVIVVAKEDYRIFSLLAGGAIGNLIDRVTLGYVVDFVDIAVSGHHWPALNVADSALSIGIVLLTLNLLIKRN